MCAKGVSYGVTGDVATLVTGDFARSCGHGVRIECLPGGRADISTSGERIESMNYAAEKGYRNERKTVKVLETAGFLVTKSGGSLGLFDLIAVGSRIIRLIQVKSNRNASPVEREQIRDLRVPPNCTKEVWVWRDYQRKPIIYEL